MKASQQDNKKKNQLPLENKSVLQTDSSKNLALQTINENHAIKFKQNYYKTIEQPIQIIEQICINKLPQKCLIHNNNYTLYCTQDRKPLCANCVFQNSKHKVHHVLPIKNCVDILRRDSQILQNNLSVIVKQIHDMIRHINNGISTMDKHFPDVIKRVQKSYENLHQILELKQQQHKNQVRYNKQTIKYQYAILSAQLRKTAVYIEQKINQYSEFKMQDELLTKKNVLDTLSLSSKLLKNQINSKISFSQIYTLNFRIFDDIQVMMDQQCSKLFHTLEGQHIKTLKNNKKSVSPNKQLLNSKASRSISSKKVRPRQQEKSGHFNRISSQNGTSPPSRRQTKTDKNSNSHKKRVQHDKESTHQTTTNNRNKSKTPTKNRYSPNK